MKWSDLITAWDNSLYYRNEFQYWCIWKTEEIIQSIYIMNYDMKRIVYTFLSSYLQQTIVCIFNNIVQYIDSMNYDMK